MTKETNTNASLMSRRAAAVPRGIGNAHPVFTDRAENAELWDVEGRRYIDFCSGIAVVNTGHNHPQIVAAVSRQLGKHSHTCFQVAAYESYVELAERLTRLAPGNAPKKAIFMSTGAEAIENAVKLVRAYSGRPGVIAFNGAFHGRTMFAMALTGKVVPYKAGFGPMAAEVYHAPYPSAYHGVTVDDAIGGIEKLFKNDIDPSRVGAIFVEPVQGEGGYIPGSAEFFQRLRALCDTHGILLVADEIQTGIGRTGKLFAMDHFGVVPDLMTLAKGLGGGMPISAVVGRTDIMDSVAPGGLGSTYAGHPMACASALAVLDVIEEEGLCERSLAIGERLRARFRGMEVELPCIGDVRGLGAMTAIELVDPVTRAPSADLANRLKSEAFNRGLMLLTCGNYGNVIRVMVPLTISDATLDEGLSIIDTVLRGIQADA